MRVTNLTRHPILIQDEDGVTRLTLEPPTNVNQLARVREIVKQTDSLELPNGLIVPVFIVSYEEPANSALPPYEPGNNTYYIVPRIVSDMYRDRDDLIYPYQLARTPNGLIEGCKAFARFSHANGACVNSDCQRERSDPEGYPRR